jgi:hypothetical protein
VLTDLYYLYYHAHNGDVATKIYCSKCVCVCVCVQLFGIAARDTVTRPTQECQTKSTFELPATLYILSVSCTAAGKTLGNSCNP